ncbi:hypothetical protein ACFLS1_06650 [Verrucomicrobiota bacterium]
MKFHKLHLGKAKCAVDLGDGSERGEYVCQDYILHKLGRPHRNINLMYCYYPLDKEWPRRASEVSQTNNASNAWGYCYDDYFPYQHRDVKRFDDDVKTDFVIMRDIRKHGQDVTLTLTIDCGVPDNDLIRIARDLKSFGRMHLRINHEATGTWFAFSKRYSYQQVADFFVKFHNIIKKEAPNIRTVLCVGGIKDPDKHEIEYEKEFTEALRTTDIWSIDNYIALHWGWPYDIAEPGINNHKIAPVDQIHDLNKRSYERFKFLNNGVYKDIVLSELNADGDVTGNALQPEIVKEFYNKIKDGKYDFYSAITMYQFRDQGRLGLEQEDPNNKDIGIEQPLLQVYKNIIADPHFQPAMPVSEEIQLPAKLRWGSAEDSDGIAIPVEFEKHPVFCEVTFEEPLNLMMEINGRWFYKAPEVKTIDLMPAFFDRKIKNGSTLRLNIFAPPPAGENDSTQGEDWAENYYAELTLEPSFRIRYQPAAMA